ncbi:hypothetical protein ERJ75_000998500 [Trypanosoma vivax]|uniref:Uncharacterized protein n=1 Tax=Trypanosoma vivax (strain Y486) TaxID=1055687 RepID=G0UAV1_TRYVY|nr:hypothetical protein ERJ75_000998500 [Trypanosoma vivax]CCC52938.1 conserved hypothetical protein [Trypanosoma vivax Y486]
MEQVGAATSEAVDQVPPAGTHEGVPLLPDESGKVTHDNNNSNQQHEASATLSPPIQADRSVAPDQDPLRSAMITPEMGITSIANVSPLKTMTGEAAKSCPAANMEKSPSPADQRMSVTQDWRCTSIPALLTPAVSMSTVLRREEEVMETEVFKQLCFERQSRRHHPSRGLDKKHRTFVYYNHLSKGHFVPHEVNEGDITLTYNHMYYYGDGSRFRRSGDSALRTNPSVLEKGTTRFRPPVRRSTKAMKPVVGACRETSAHGPNATGLSQHTSRRSETRRTASVNVARSLQVSDLRAKPFEKRITIEEVIASDVGCVERSREGISSVVGKGKVPWSEVKEELRHSFSLSQARFTESLHLKGTTQDHTREEALRCFPTGSLPSGSGCERQPFSCSQKIKDKYNAMHLSSHAHGTHDDSTPRSKVLFTDHASNVLFGFTKSVALPKDVERDVSNTLATQKIQKLSFDGPAAKECGLMGDGLPPTADCAGTEGSATADEFADGTHKGRSEILLPPIAMAELRDRELLANGNYCVQSDTVKLLGTKWMPQEPLPYETSRLSYLRQFDVGEARPPPGMIHWTQSRGLC